MSRRPRLAISLGDPCGIGPELLLGSLPAILQWTDVTVVGARAGADLLEGLPGNRVVWRWTDSGQAPSGFTGKVHGLQVLPLGDLHGRVLAECRWLDPAPEIGRDSLKLGEGSAASGRATVEAVRVASRLVLEGAADALVTLPMAKSAAHLAGFNIPGHTEFLQELSGAPITRMAFLSPRLNVVLHTVHQSLRSVVETLDADAVAETLIFSTGRFSQLTGNLSPRVALCALNPHAGEQGAFGDEERILDEAIALAKASTGELAPAARPRFFGPLPSDSLFHRAARGEFDLVVALYHDQGLIPIKLLEPARAVNVTLGLPFIRTSPDHGTAFDKAGKWVADAQNFLEATALAVRLAGRARQLDWSAQVVPPPA